MTATAVQEKKRWPDTVPTEADIDVVSESLGEATNAVECFKNHLQTYVDKLQVLSDDAPLTVDVAPTIEDIGRLWIAVSEMIECDLSMLQRELGKSLELVGDLKMFHREAQCYADVHAENAA